MRLSHSNAKVLLANSFWPSETSSIPGSLIHAGAETATSSNAESHMSTLLYHQAIGGWWWPPEYYYESYAPDRHRSAAVNLIKTNKKKHPSCPRLGRLERPCDICKCVSCVAIFSSKSPHPDARVGFGRAHTNKRQPRGGSARIY